MKYICFTHDKNMRLYLVSNKLEVKLTVIKEVSVSLGEEWGFRESRPCILLQAEFVRARQRGEDEGSEGKLWPAQEQ